MINVIVFVFLNGRWLMILREDEATWRIGGGGRGGRGWVGGGGGVKGTGEGGGGGGGGWEMDIYIIVCCFEKRNCIVDSHQKWVSLVSIKWVLKSSM